MLCINWPYGLIKWFDVSLMGTMLEKIWFLHFIFNLSMAALLYPYSHLTQEDFGLDRYLNGYHHILIILGLFFSILTLAIPKLIKDRLFERRLTLCNDRYFKKFEILNLSTYLVQWALLEIITLVGLIYVNILPNQTGLGVFLLFFSFSIFFSLIKKPISS